MKLYNTFTGGAMNKDIEIRLLPKNFYIDARNVRITTPDAGNSRSVKFALGNTVQSSVAYEGSNPTCIGSCVDNFRNLIYYAVATSTHSYVVEYNVGTDSTRVIVDDINSTGVFNFTTDMYVEMRVINDNENGKNYLVLTDGENEPKYFEIDTIEAMAVDSYLPLDVELIKAAPETAPVLLLNNTGTTGENNLETKFLSFAYRYKYQNEEFSALSPFSEFAFFPKTFQYNFREGTNNSMFNNFAKADIDFNVGPSQVTDVEIIVKESQSNTAYIVQTYNKSSEGWADNTTQTITFDNSRIYQALDANQLSRVYDNVPLEADTLEVIGNRIVFGNYTENYNIEYLDTPITPNFTVDYVTSTGTAGQGHTQVKTNRDYELAIAYTDGKGRMSTPLVADGNTVYVPYSVANEKVQLRLTIDRSQRPPDWATGYRIFVKQSKNDYDVLAPVIFYRDGIYAWIKLEGNDRQKVSEGDFLFVKSDTDGLKANPIRTKVLEITEQPVNFLEDTAPDPFEVLQESGIYMRVQVSGFALNPGTLGVYEYIGAAFRSDNQPNNIVDIGNAVAEDVYFQGSGKEELDIANNVNLDYTSNQDRRFEVEITGSGTPNTFRWRELNVTTNTLGSFSGNINITGGAQFIGSVSTTQGVDIQFDGTTGYTIGDKWFISIKAQGRVDDWDKGGSVSSIRRSAIVIYASKPPNFADESISAGANINITYDDASSSGNVANKIGFKTMTFTSSRDYPNIEEWYYGDNIFSEPQFAELVKNGDAENVLFRRGFTSGGGGGKEILNVNYAKDGGGFVHPMNLTLLSAPNYAGGGQINIDHSLIITEFDNPVLFETIPEDITTDIFFELPYTYGVAGGVHLGDTSQIFGAVDAVVTLDYFNSFGWYNGFESIKIGDTFNEKIMLLDTKPLVPVENYQQVKRINSLTYGGVYESTTQFNALNEFNLATANFKDLDIAFGAIRKLYSRDTDLIVFQHDKTQRVLFNKSVLFNADGTGNVSQSLNVLGQEVAFSGEYGIGDHPESFAFFGNRIYHIDKDRGALMRLSIDGYTEISQQGMLDYFRTLPNQNNFVGGYDPYNDEYIINVQPDGDPLTLAFKEQVGFTSFYTFEPERMVGINNRLYSIKDGQVWLHDNETVRNTFYSVKSDAQLVTAFNDVPQDVKHFKSVNLESTFPWVTSILTDFGNGTIATAEYEQEEQEWYAYIRQSEDTVSDVQPRDSALGGIGTISGISSLVISVNGVLPRALAVGDQIYRVLQVDDSVINLVGNVTDYDPIAQTITVDADAVGLFSGDFIVHAKDERIEGASMKGHWLQLTLTSNSPTDDELFGVKVEAVRSSD